MCAQFSALEDIAQRTSRDPDSSALLRSSVVRALQVMHQALTAAGLLNSWHLFHKGCKSVGQLCILVLWNRCTTTVTLVLKLFLFVFGACVAIARNMNVWHTGMSALIPPLVQQYLSRSSMTCLHAQNGHSGRCMSVLSGAS